KLQFLPIDLTFLSTCHHSSSSPGIQKSTGMQALPSNIRETWLNKYQACERYGMSGNVGTKRLTDHAVYELLQRIPPGTVSTYGDIARALGHPKASRAVGRILGRNQNLVVVPCHRVVKSDGTIGGYGGGVEKKRELLEKE